MQSENALQKCLHGNIQVKEWLNFVFMLLGSKVLAQRWKVERISWAKILLQAMSSKLWFWNGGVSSQTSTCVSSSQQSIIDQRHPLPFDVETAENNAEVKTFCLQLRNKIRCAHIFCAKGQEILTKLLPVLRYRRCEKKSWFEFKKSGAITRMNDS